MPPLISRSCIPGNIMYKGTKIQLLDLPGIIEGAAHGRGRGRQVREIRCKYSTYLGAFFEGK